MARLLNRNNNIVQEVPDEQVQSAFLSGEFGFEKGVPIPVLNASGEEGTIDPGEALRAFNAGFTFQTQGDRDRRAKELQIAADEERFGDSPILAGAAGVARGVTLGLSDFVLTELGLVSKETLRGLERANLAASITGEIAGTAIPLLVPEPTTTAAGAARLPFLAARLTRLAGTGPRAIAKAGRAVQAGVEARTGSKIASNIVAGGVEGALFSASQIVSEQALGDPELIAEQTLADKGLRVLELAGQGALFGAAIPATIGATRLAGRIVSPVTKGIRKKVGEAINAQNIAEFGQRQAFKSLGPTSRETARVMRDIGGRERMGADIQATGFATLRDLPAFSQHVNKLGDRVGSGYRALDELATTAGTFPKATEFSNFLKANVIDPMLRDPRTAGFGRKIQKELVERLRNLDRPIAGGKSNINVKLDKKTGIFDVKTKRSRGTPAQDPDMTFDTLWQTMRAVDKTINWGDQSAKGFNFASTQLRNGIRRFLDKEAVRIGGRNFTEEFKEANRLFHSLKTAESIALSAESRAFSNRSVGLMDHISGILVGSTSGSFLLGMGAVAISKFLIRERGNEILSRTADRISKLSILQKSAKSTEEKSAGIISRIAGKEPKRPALIAGASILASLDLSEDRKPIPEGRAEQVNHQVQQMEELAADPDRLTDRIAGALGDLDTLAPDISSTIAMRAGEILEFLLGKAPRRETAPGLFGGQFSPSVTAMARWDRYLRGVNEPLSVLDDVARGRLTPEGVETLRTVYPRLYEELKQKIIEKIAEDPDAVDHQTRVQLSMFFGVPLEPTTDPEFIASIQIRYSQRRDEGDVEVPGNEGGPVAEQRKSQRISKAAFDNSQQPQAFQTETQRIASGRV